MPSLKPRLHAVLLTLCAGLALAGAGVWAFADAPRKPSPSARPTAAELARAVRANNAFTWALWPKLTNPQAPANTLFSPPSLAITLAMAAAGANGPTRDELWSAMTLDPRPDPLTDLAGLVQAFQLGQPDKTQLTFANALWADKSRPLKPEYIARMNTALGAKAQNLDFNDPKAADTINKWISASTRDKIKTLDVSPPPPNFTQLVLTSAVYFKADWHEPFTTLDKVTFNVTPEKSTTVTMLSGTPLCSYAQDDSFQMVQIPYHAGKTLFRAILPAHNKTPGQLNGKTLDNLLKKAKLTKVQILLPKFTMQWQQDFIAPLVELKVKRAFSNYADFSNTFVAPSPIGPDIITRIVQKTFIQVDETGTTAAAVTGATSSIFAVGDATPKETIPQFTANRPFIFQIVDAESGAIIFMGLLADPNFDSAPSPAN